MKELWQNKYIKVVLITVAFICLFLMVCPYLFLTLKMNGDAVVELEYKSTYQEMGATANLFSKLMAVEVIGNVDTSKLGTQQVIYQVKNNLGTIKTMKRIIKVVDKTPPQLTLLGDSTITIRQGNHYKDPGYQLIDNVEGDISSHVQVIGTVDVNKVGTYEILYQGQDSSNNQVETKRTIKVIPKEITYQVSYDAIDNRARTWWSGNKKDHQRPLTGAAATIEDLKPYNAYYLGPDKKIIYLTFDEGSNDTYVKEIMDVLNKYQVKGTFFFCSNYIKMNPELMKQLVKSGHSVGNHTAHHKAMYQFANKEKINEYIKEIRQTEDVFYQITGKELDKVYREPRGDWSYRSLQIVKDMGYKSFFWSADYLDWNGDVSSHTALDNYMARYHNGAIYLIHPKNKGNYQAMGKFIENMKSLGYEFGLVKDIE